MTSFAEVISLAAAFCISLVLTSAILRYIGKRLVDVPGVRSSHTQPTPTGGGVGFIVAFLLTVLAAVFWSPRFGNPPVDLLLLVITPLAIVGFYDDKRGVAKSVRYLVQFCVALAMLWYVRPASLLLGSGDIKILLLVSFLLAIGVTAVINFYNFMDGMDGFVAGVTAVQLGFLGYWLGQPAWWLLAIALVGFLVMNWAPAKIFMGDVGSTVLGALVALAVLNHQKSSGWAWYYLVITLPLLGDAVYTISRRLLRGENIFQAHHSHIYQRLMRTGWGHGLIASLYILFTLFMGLFLTCLGVVGAILSAVLFAIGLVLAETRIAKRNVPFSVGEIT
jgi:UDP-N-acetylmuramyl pentapeptide phosphotransferase/UDP-N-acetylglucosamine-1-phosphate transferase